LWSEISNLKSEIFFSSKVILSAVLCAWYFVLCLGTTAATGENLRDEKSRTEHKELNTKYIF
jgi:hypothetical protein